MSSRKIFLSFVSSRLLGFLRMNDTTSTKFDQSKVRSQKSHSSCTLTETLVRSGFYGVTYYIGFREDFEVNVSW